MPAAGGSEGGRALGGDGEGALEGDADAGECAFFEKAADQGDAVGHAARGENFGRGFFGSGAQSDRASETSTKPARSVSEGCPVWLLMVSISSRSEGTSGSSTSEKGERSICRHKRDSES